MTENRCLRCGRPMPDSAYVCAPEGQALADVLLVAAGHAEDAETVIARQARYGAGSRGGSSDGLNYDATRSARFDRVRNTVGGWMRIALEESGAPTPRPWRAMSGPLCQPRSPGHHVPWQGHRCPHRSCEEIRDRTPPSELAQALTWLSEQTGWLRKHPAADEAFRELHDACAELARLIDVPADKELVGMCDCGKVLYAPPGTSHVKCPEKTCALRWNVAESRDILRKALDGKLVTVSEAARLIAYLDSKRTQDTIRKLVTGRIATGQIVAHGLVDDEPTYVFGEVVAILAAIPMRKSRASNARRDATMNEGDAA